MVSSGKRIGIWFNYCEHPARLKVSAGVSAKFMGFAIFEPYHPHIIDFTNLYSVPTQASRDPLRAVFRK